MSFFEELKRRNVVRVAIAYAVASWVLIQIGDVAAQNFEAPVWVMKMFMTALMAGFPIVLFFSWAYEITPDGIKKESEIDRSHSISNETGKKLDFVTIALLVLAIAFIGYDRMVPQSQATPVAVEQSAISAEPTLAEPVSDSGVQDNSIAVLPFLNMSDDPQQEYFSDGIAEELLNLLVRVDGLQVASRTSSFAYKGEATNIPEIARDLKVANILEGSVRKSGNQVRITAQLIDTRNDRHLWSDTYDRELTDIFAIQDEIANSIVDALRNELGLEVSSDNLELTDIPENMDAYDLYLQGRAILISRGHLPDAVRLLERAVELDPNYARAWADLGAAAWVAPGWSFYDRDYTAISANAIERALALDDSQSMAWAVKSYLRHQDVNGRDYNETLAYLDRALETDPKNATAALWRGLAKSELAYHENAIEDFKLCLKIDPAYLNCKFHLGNTLAMIGRTQEAVETTRELFREGFAGIRAANIQMLINMNETLTAYALAAQRSDHPDYPRKEWLDALEYPERDHSKGLARAIKYLEQEKRVGLAENLLLAFGAYDLLEIDDHYPQTWIWTSGFPEFRKSAGFKRLAAELNLQAYWREHGFPPQCRPVGIEDFECD